MLMCVKHRGTDFTEDGVRTLQPQLSVSPHVMQKGITEKY